MAPQAPQRSQPPRHSRGGARRGRDVRLARHVQLHDRLGAKFDGVIRAARVAVDGVIRDTAAFSILEAEWPGVKPRLTARLASAA